METTLTARAIARLTEDDPSYRELLDLYRSLRTEPGTTHHEDVAQFALAQLVGEFVDYLDLVGAEFEKTIGLTRGQERKRLLGELSPPTGEEPLERVADLVRQWRAAERYTHEEIVESLAVEVPESQLDA